jgi:hypothetical protein
VHGIGAAHLVTYRCGDHAEAVTDTAGGADTIRMGSARGRWILLTTVLGSGLALLDSTVVNIALERIGAEFDASFAALQWTINGYTLTLAAARWATASDVAGSSSSESCGSRWPRGCAGSRRRWSSSSPGARCRGSAARC